MPEPLLGSLATKLAGSVLSVAGPRLKRQLLGADEERAFQRALERAFASLLSAIPDPDDRETVDLVGSQLATFFSEPPVADMLVDVALRRRMPNMPVLRDLLWELGFDSRTLGMDFEAMMATLTAELAGEIRREARQREGVLFNEVVLAELEELRSELGRLDGVGGRGRVGLPRPGRAPPLPSLVVGRDVALHDLKCRLGIGSGAATEAFSVITAVRGWPGVGKTTLAAWLAHDAEVIEAYPDGVLWASLGRPEHAFAELVSWTHALSVVVVGDASADELSTRLRAVLRDQRALLVLDDVWEAADVIPFRVGGAACATVVTTRRADVANALAGTAADVYVLDVLDEASGVEVLERLCPEVVADNGELAHALVRTLEGLPLALQVAGRLLHSEARLGLGVGELVEALHTGAALLTAEAPVDRRDLADETAPTVAVLLRQSTDRLDAVERERFAILGAFAPTPATFDVRALTSVWETADVRPTVGRLVDHGLLEPLGDGRFQMHALLVRHAESLLED